MSDLFKTASSSIFKMILSHEPAEDPISAFNSLVEMLDYTYGTYVLTRYHHPANSKSTDKIIDVDIVSDGVGLNIVIKSSAYGKLRATINDVEDLDVNNISAFFKFKLEDSPEILVSFLTKYFDHWSSPAKYYPNAGKDSFKLYNIKPKFGLHRYGNVIVDFKSRFTGDSTVYVLVDGELPTYKSIEVSNIETVIDYIRKGSIKNGELPKEPIVAIPIESVESEWVVEHVNKLALEFRKRDKELTSHLELVLQKHQMYVDAATRLEMTLPSPIRNYASYLAFIKMLKIPTYFDDYEVENYLRSKGLYGN